MSQEILQQIREQLLELDLDATVAAARQIVDQGDKKLAKSAVESLTQGLEIVGERFQSGEWFLNELVYAGEISREVLDLLSPLLETGDESTQDAIVVGTVAHDLHDLGKNIFGSFARSAGFRVIDLGVDIPVEQFVDAAREYQPIAVGLSCMLTPAAQGIESVVLAIREQEFSVPVRVIAGGAAVTQELVTSVGADAFAPDAVTGLNQIRAWGEQR
ncbi:MAG: cobalamin-binding protein [Halieaceae bacterium]|jgi:methanogenic corrinoid protein MtbC1|nr:cobalamin-binding protein [Halieaceae bacterium]